MNEFDMKAKIEKLFAKAESTTSEHERLALEAKATKLMVQLGIARADLEASGKVQAEDIIEAHRDYPGNYSIVMIPFGSALARAFGNLSVLQSKPYSKSGLVRRIHIIGFASDVADFLLLHDSLVTQSQTALRAWQRDNREDRRYFTDQEKYLGNRSFLQGFGSMAARRMREMRKVTIAEEASPGAALVLVGRQDKVDAWTQEKHNPQATRRGGLRSHDQEGFYAGAEAGSRADVGGRGVSDGRSGSLTA